MIGKLLAEISTNIGGDFEDDDAVLCQSWSDCGGRDG